MTGDKPWRDKELVNRLYHEEQMSGPEIAEELGCSVGPIYERIENTRSRSEAHRIWTWKLPLNVRTDKDGYERFQTKVYGEHQTFSHHRLLAVAEHGFNAVSDNVVHHENGIPWDNRPDNLTVMDQSNHVREHLEEIPQYEKTAMWAFRETNYTAEDVGEMFDHSRSTVTTVWKRIEDGDYPITEVNA
jgi:DNA-directed RNA polymerase specialized sigma24 family protein